MHYTEEEPGMKIRKTLDISKSNGSAPTCSRLNVCVLRVPKSIVYRKYESDVMGSQAFEFYHHWGSTLSQRAIRELTHLRA